MTHFVLLKLADGVNAETVEQRVKQTYQQLDEALPYLNYPVIYRNCVVRGDNADIMIQVQLDSPDQLQSYLTHPLHVQMGQDLKSSLSAKISFDYL